jgi:hypothetical protein
LSLSHELPYLYAVTTPFWKLNRDNPPPTVAGLQSIQQNHGILPISERTNLDPQDPHIGRTTLVSNHTQLHLIGAITGHAQRMGSGKRKIEDTPLCERTPVINTNRDMPSSAQGSDDGH